MPAPKNLCKQARINLDIATSHATQCIPNQVRVTRLLQMINFVVKLLHGFCIQLNQTGLEDLDSHLYQHLVSDVKL